MKERLDHPNPMVSTDDASSPSFDHERLSRMSMNDQKLYPVLKDSGRKKNLLHRGLYRVDESCNILADLFAAEHGRTSLPATLRGTCPQVLRLHGGHRDQCFSPAPIRRIVA